MSRYIILLMVLGLTALTAFMWFNSHATVWLWVLVILTPLSLLGLRDILQKRHAVLRNYPLTGHIRFLLESIRPELRQYFFSSDQEERPFNRVQRSLVYQRSKATVDTIPYGTQLDVYEARHAWLNHSINPSKVVPDACTITIGNDQCKQPYVSSVLNISAMSFGALSANAIKALNRGARLGNFAHDTGEGSISRHHRSEGGDLIWELGTGYFGCRAKDGGFDPDQFAERAQGDQVKMVELKLSQGAKPGHGGLLPAAKITPEIAEARGIPMDEDCHSPANHSAFSTPNEMMEFIQEMRDLSGGKPAGFKLCIGHRWEFMALAKAMVETNIHPDFIVIDGAEGGTGAAPVEFSNHVGTPLVEGLHFANQVLNGVGLRDKVKLGASGKIVSAFDMIRMFSLGADFCNSARAFMLSLGCIQSLSCHTNKCPVGIATQDDLRQRALDVDGKARRVANYHRNTIHALCDALSSAGVSHPRDLQHNHLFMRDGDGIARYIMTERQFLGHGELLTGTNNDTFKHDWEAARTDSFLPN